MLVLLILTPLLLLAIVSLLGFVGCTTFTGTDSGEAFVITTTSPLPDATVNAHYATAMAASLGVAPYHWTIVGGTLPTGLTMDDAGNISGIATGAPGKYSVTIQVADSTTSSNPSKTPMPQTAQGPFDLNLITSPTAPKIAAINPASGPTAGGTAITVGGSNFVAGAKLALGGVAASGVTVAGGTSLTATTGAHAAGAVDVVVTNPDGQFATLPSGFSYLPAAVAHTGNTDIATAAGATSTSIQSAVIPLTGAGAKLLVVTVAWGGGSLITGGVPTFVSGGAGATFQAVAAAVTWNGMQVQTFFANGVAAGSVQVKVQFGGTVSSASKLCTSAYNNAATGNPVYSPVATPDGQTGTALHSAAPINASQQDLVYAVGLAATSAGAFPGGITITPGLGFTAEPGPGNPLVEDQQIATTASVTPTATSGGGATSRWFMFAMGIKHA